MPIESTDPIHGRIRLSDRHSELLHSAALARLRNVRQLGFTLANYPGAVHTRFEHTIGTAAVLESILDQFEVADEELRERYVMSALVSEVGIYPMSYSSRAVFNDGHSAKAEYKHLIYTGYLERNVGVPWADEASFATPGDPRHAWFHMCPGAEDFRYLTPIALASTIDYVLRDAYFSGRYTSGFDYRFFSSIRRVDSYDTRREMSAALRELHRAAHSLNWVYGDRTRRFLTALLSRLAHRLDGGSYLDISAMKSAAAFIELDDDVFFGAIGAAAIRAQADGDKLSGKMFEIVSQTHAVEVHTWPLRSEVSTSPAQLEQQIADELGVSADGVVCLGDRLRDSYGFRMFGREYPSYADAVRSEHFRRLTGLAEADDRTGLERSGTVYYIIVE